MEKEVKEVKIEKTYKVGKEGAYLIMAILSFLVVFVIILVFGSIYLIQPDVLFSPSSISLFFMNLNDSYEVAIGDKVSMEEEGLIKRFVLEFGELKTLRESESFSMDGLLIVGVAYNFIDVPYLEYLEDNDSVVIYNSEQDSLYIYSKDLGSLKEVLNILKNNSESLEYLSMKINKGVMEELMV